MSWVRRTYQGCAGFSFMAMSLAIVAFVTVLFTTAGPFKSTRANGVGGRDANQKLWHCHLPAEATDVWLVSAYRATTVECTLEEDAFLAWSRYCGWRLTPITSDDGCRNWSLRSNTHTPIIEDGFKFDVRSGGELGCFGIYDRKHRRAYVNYTGG